MKISVLTASVRPEGLDIVYQCLKKQDFPHDQFEWIVVGNHDLNMIASFDCFNTAGFPGRYFKERPKKEGDFYNVDKAYNDLYKNASGELAVMWTDLTWAPATVLTDFWTHYQNNPKACVGGIGHQYEIVEMGKPQVEVWHDPRARTDFGSFYEIYPIDFEMCLASIPTQAMKDVGGFEEDYDLGAAVGEKEVALRMDKAGYKFYLDQSIEYRAVKHPRLNGKEEWDKHYEVSCALLQHHLYEINQGRRLKLNYLSS